VPEDQRAASGLVHARQLLEAGADRRRVVGRHLGERGRLDPPAIPPDVASAGPTFGPWVNRESPGLPRASRLFIYIGYGLVAVTLINWSLTAHVLSELEYYTGAGALQGFSRFGTPLLYVVFGVVLAAVMRERRPPPLASRAA